ncbi:rhodanese-like domain-containing protein [Sulfurimonas microaerophilic]|uniref:rhodanese-like domain-containing protein n=1 Tax=Sulfurimonas microaerophilic TaxID=3058392 RepID=UPI0027151E60|nr:rhodanese-like domain-containing protein [Sulfurimonas sp. hsl 1-7]
MRNLNTKLEEYAKRFDEIFLSEHLKAVIEEANRHVVNIDVEELYDISKDIILIDVREPEEFSSGYINAHTVLTIPRGKLEFMAIEKVAKQFGQDAQIVTYCLKGPRGALAAYQLQKLGFTNVKNLSGGILHWLAKGNTIHNYLGELSLA